MSATRGRTRVVPALAGALLLLGALALWGPGNEEDGGIEVGPAPRVTRSKPCYRWVTFTANWERRSVVAKQVEWGPVGVTATWWNVPAPWQPPRERVACGATVKLEVVFPDGVRPGRTLCAITANNEVYEPVEDPEHRYPWCYVQTVVR